MDIIDEKNLSQSNSAERIRVIHAAGNPIKINASDLAELIRSNMSLVTKTKTGLSGIVNAFISCGVLSGSNVDLDNISQGSYRFTTAGGDISNTPSSAIGAGFLICIYPSSTGDTHKLQLCWDIASYVLYIRHYTSGKWGEWRRITTTVL